MLRSLVGSEMCIRDRFLNSPIQDACLNQLWVHNPVAVDPDGDSLSYEPTCLLYTSDAADDLLCVDLGGRRIIKKKKNTTINTINDTTKNT